MTEQERDSCCTYIARTPGTRKNPRVSGGFLVGGTGIEPATSSVSGKRATAAPTAQGFRITNPRWRRDLNPCTRLCRPLPRLSATPPRAGCTRNQWSLTLPTRADDEIRTRDPHLGKVMRYHCATSACPHCCVLYDCNRSRCAGPILLQARRALWQDCRRGRLAQLVARFLHTEEVIGSSPVSPTRAFR